MSSPRIENETINGNEVAADSKGEKCVALRDRQVEDVILEVDSEADCDGNETSEGEAHAERGALLPNGSTALPSVVVDSDDNEFADGLVSSRDVRPREREPASKISASGVTFALHTGTTPAPKIKAPPLYPTSPSQTDPFLLPLKPHFNTRPSSANETANDKGNTVFFGQEPGDYRSLPRTHHTSENGKQLYRNFSVESGGSGHGSQKGHRLRKSRSRSSIKPPDGGWGWVIVFASFMISMIADGISFSFGIFFVDLSEYFNASKSKTAFVGSLFLSMPLILGPLASALTDRYGCRIVTIISGVLSASGFILGYFAYTLEHLFLAFSISGAGLALSYVTSIVIVAYYFEKRRSLATGLAVCGTGVGTFIFAPLTIYLMEKFTWRGTLLIMAGFFLNIVVFGALMRDLPEPDDDEISNRSSDFESDNFTNETLEQMRTHKTSNHPDKVYSSLAAPKPRLFSSLVHIPTYITHRGSSCDPQEIMNELTAKKGGYLSQLVQRYPTLMASFFLGQRDTGQNLRLENGASNKMQLNGASVAPERKLLVHKENFIQPLPKSPSICVRSPRQRPTVGGGRHNSLIPFEMNSNYLRNLRVQRGSISYRSAMLNIRRYRLRASSCPDIYRNSIVTISSNAGRARSCFEDMKETFSDIIDLSIFKSLKYTLFCVSNLLLYACIDVPYVYMPDHAIHTGASGKETSSFLISVIGIVNTLGIVLVGYIGDKPWIEPSLLYSCFISLAGVSMGLIPLIHDYAGLATLAALYGFTISANYALVSVILVDLISLDKFTNGYGLLLLVQGIASLIGPPFAGWLFDLTGSYDVTFYVTGLCIFVSGAIVIPIAGTDNNCTNALLNQTERGLEMVDEKSELNGGKGVLGLDEPCESVAPCLGPATKKPEECCE